MRARQQLRVLPPIRGFLDRQAASEFPGQPSSAVLGFQKAPPKKPRPQPKAGVWCPGGGGTGMGDRQDVS